MLRLTIFTAALLTLVVGSAFATKQDEIDQMLVKPWSLTDILVLSSTVADVDEVEPNDTCPGNAYTMGDVFHAAIDVGGDFDWISFTCNAGDAITIGTDADGALPTVDTLIELFADDCATSLAIDDDGGPGLYSLISDFEAPYTGTYNLKIRAYGSTSTGNYLAIGNCVTPPGPTFCPIGQYKGSKLNVNEVISDALGPLVTIPISFPIVGQVVTDVVVDLEIDHTWIGDLDVVLRHTSDGGVVTEASLMARPGVPETSFGCSGDMVGDPQNKYYFATREDLAPVGEFDCPAVIDPMCYAVAVENPNGLEAFRGIGCGDGEWVLEITDNAAGDDGYCYNWSLHILCDAPVSVEDESWGGVKSLYR
jgi:hypothetical protein